MKCQHCKEREANVKIMKQVSGKAPQMLMLCDECARELGIALPGNLLGGGIFGGAMGNAGSGNAMGGFGPGIAGNAAGSTLGGLGLGAMTNPLEMLASAFTSPFGLGLEGLADESDEISCPTCKMTKSQFTKSGFLGCSDCYSVFSEYIDPVFLRTQMGAKHMGRKPGKSGDIDLPVDLNEKAPTIKQVHTKADDLEDLPEAEKEKRMQIMEKERLLKQAVKEENYTEAARLRDEIQALKGEEDKK